MISADLTILLALGALGCREADRSTSPYRSIEIVEEMRIGGLATAEAYSFSHVQAVAPALDGSVYVADRQGPSIRSYDAQGRHTGDVGRPGQGPGEFESIYGMGVRYDGRLIVWDPANARVSQFSPQGEWESSLPVLQGVGGLDWSFVASRDGDLYVLVYPDDFDFVERDGTFDWARIHDDGTLERVARHPAQDRQGPRYVVSGRGGMYYPFVAMTLSTLGPDGSHYVMRNDTFRITHVRPEGDTTYIFRDERRVPLAAEELAEWTARSERLARRNPALRERYFPIPDPKPFVRRLAVDLDGRLWVSRYTESTFMSYSVEEAAYREERGLARYQWRDEPRWDVFGSDDQYIGSVTLPFKTTFVTASGDQMWGIQAGDFNEDYVVRWRLELDP